MSDQTKGETMKPANSNATEKLLNDSDVAEMLGVAVNTIRSWRHRKEGPPFIRVGMRTVRYRSRDVMAFLDKQTVAASR